jgi:hypothetical protein
MDPAASLPNSADAPQANGGFFAGPLGGVPVSSAGAGPLSSQPALNMVSTDPQELATAASAAAASVPLPWLPSSLPLTGHPGGQDLFTAAAAGGTAGGGPPMPSGPSSPLDWLQFMSGQAWATGAASAAGGAQETPVEHEEASEGPGAGEAAAAGAASGGSSSFDDKGSRQVDGGQVCGSQVMGQCIVFGWRDWL